MRWHISALIFRSFSIKSRGIGVGRPLCLCPLSQINSFLTASDSGDSHQPSLVPSHPIFTWAFNLAKSLICIVISPVSIAMDCLIPIVLGGLGLFKEMPGNLKTWPRKPTLFDHKSLPFQQHPTEIKGKSWQLTGNTNWPLINANELMPVQNSCWCYILSIFSMQDGFCSWKLSLRLSIKTGF